MLYALNVYSDARQLFLNKTGKKDFLKSDPSSTYWLVHIDKEDRMSYATCLGWTGDENRQGFLPSKGWWPSVRNNKLVNIE